MRILEDCSPFNLENKENVFIRKLKTLYPMSPLNKNNPFGLAIINLALLDYIALVDLENFI